MLERETTNVLNPDSDGDGLSDGLEVKTYGTDPNNEDTDNDGLLDGEEIDEQTDPFNPDTDGDGLTDAQEVKEYSTDPRVEDSDCDGLNDGDEVNSVPPSDPNNPNDPVDGGGDGECDPTDPKRDPFAQRKNPALVFTQEVKAPDVFTPFGNGVRVVKFGDDGSQVVEDNSGILLWGRRLDNGSYEYTSIDGTEKAAAIDVSNAELITWTNKYEDFDTYAERDPVVISLFRFNAAGELTETSVPVQGKEIVDTPTITTTTNSRIITTTERIEGPRNLNSALTVFDDAFFDALVIRIYRVTTTGEIQRIGTYNDADIELNADDFAQTQSGPGIEALGYGSDGSQVLRYEDFADGVVKAGSPFLDPDVGDDPNRPIFINKVLWADGLGNVDVLSLDTVNELDPDTAIERTLFVSDQRIVLEVNREIREQITETIDLGFGFTTTITREEVTGSIRELRDYRRVAPGSGQIGFPVIIPLTNEDERILDIGNLTIRGNITFFYTTDGRFLRSYELTDSGARNIGEIEVSVGVADAAKINPDDGSAIIESSDPGTPLLWVFPTAVEPADKSLRFIQLESSGEASALFATNDELVIWNNAYAGVVFGTGVREEAEIQYLVRSDPEPDGDEPQLP